VVDPGVGTDRHIIAAEIESHFYIAPDNGLLTLVTRRSTAPRFVRLNRSRFWRPLVSRTFHGRDVMAPVAAHLARGVPLEELGGVCDQIVMLNDIDPVIESGIIRGRCLMTDSFGNLITNIDRQMLPEDLGSVEVLVDQKHAVRFVKTYANSDPGMLVALIGSSGRVEIAVVQGSAERRLNVGGGCAISVRGNR
jgi:S-adenosylmethionine hydrolase